MLFFCVQGLLGSPCAECKRCSADVSRLAAQTFLGLNDLTWVAIGAIAMIGAALGTIGLGGATYWLARTTRDELFETKREITATEKQAEASTRMIAEVQLDRDLNWRPYLVVSKTGYNDARDATDTVFLKNIGRGPAFNCVCARLYYITAEVQGTNRQVPQWRHSPDVKTIEVGGITEITLLNPKGPVPMAIFEVNPPPYPTLAIFFQDIAGRRAYRLSPPRAAPDMWTPGQAVHVWVSWYFGLVGIQVPT